MRTDEVGPTAAASESAGRFKRQREREAAERRQEQRVEDVLAHTTHIVDAIAAINGEYVHTLNDERAQLAQQVAALQTQSTRQQRQHTKDTTQVVLSELKSLRGAVSSGVKDRLIDALKAQAEQGNAHVFDAVTARVEDAMRGSLAVADAELTAERQLNRTLVEQLQGHTTTLLEEVRRATTRAYAAEVTTMERDVLVARLQAAGAFTETRLARHEQEVDALMRLVAQLAERSHFAESARAELLRAKRHVRLLERHLGLGDVVAAVQAEVTQSTSAAASSSHHAPPGPQPPPDPALRSSAPQYYALKWLEHTEMTLTELVDSWQHQEARIVEAEDRYARLEHVVKQVQQDALVVHQRYLEERQRREISDRRITDMVRERVYPSKDGAAAAEVQRLRWAYTEVVDDAAQLAVNLKVSRDELQRAEAEATRLAAEVRRLKRDAETDQVARTIQELRDEYAARVRGLEAATLRAETQLRLAQHVSLQYGATAGEAAAALEKTAAVNTELSAAAVQQATAPRTAGGQRAPPAWLDEVQRVEAQAKQLLSTTSAVKQLAATQGAVCESQVSELMRQWAAVREAQKVAAGSDSRDSRSTAGTTSHRGARGGSSSLATATSETLVASTVDAEAASAEKLQTVLGASQFALREALVLLTASLQSTDVERSRLVDTSLSDAECVAELMTEVRRVTAERDRLLAQVRVCRELLEKNHVTVVERALMHEVPVEDSLNVAEAAERIEVLKGQLAAVKQVCDRALAEVRQVAAEKEELELRLTELSRSHEVLQGHTSRLAEKLQSSMAREATLMEKNVALQTQLADLAQQPGAPDASAQTAAPATAETAAQLTQLFAALQATLERLDAEVRGLRTRGEGSPTTARAMEGSPSPSLASGVAGGGADGEKAEDASLMESLSRTGMMGIVRVLRESLSKAGVLSSSLRGAAGAQAAQLCATAGSSTAPGGVVPPPLPDTQQRALEYRAAQVQAELSNVSAERLELRERLSKAEKSKADVEAVNQRLLAISKSVMEKQAALRTENDALRNQLRQLAEAASSAQNPGDTSSSAVPVTEVEQRAAPPAAQSEQPPRTALDDERVPAPPTAPSTAATHPASEQAEQGNDVTAAPPPAALDEADVAPHETPEDDSA